VQELEAYLSAQCSRLNNLGIRRSQGAVLRRDRCRSSAEYNDTPQKPTKHRALS
jgi:hypothetical protein